MIVHRGWGNAQASSAIMVASVLELSPIPWLLSVEMAITIVTILPWIGWSYWLLDKYFLQADDSSGFRKVPGLTWESSFRRSLAFTIGYYLVRAIQALEAHWILFTIGLAYTSGDIGFKAQRIALLRCFWTPLGLTFGILLLYATGFQNDQLDYLTLVLGAAVYYILYRTGNYSLYYLTFLMMCTMRYNWAAGRSHPYDDSYNYVLQSSVMIYAGSLVVFVLELRPPPDPDAEKI